jgi:hypothetical protein
MDLTIFPLGDDQRQSRVFRSVLLQMEAASVEFRVSLGDHHQRFHPHRRDNVAANGAKSGLRGAQVKACMVAPGIACFDIHPRKRLEQVRGFNEKRFGNPGNIFEPHVPFAVLNTADMVPMQSGTLRELSCDKPRSSRRERN